MCVCACLSLVGCLCICAKESVLERVWGCVDAAPGREGLGVLREREGEREREREIVWAWDGG